MAEIHVRKRTNDWHASIPSKEWGCGKSQSEAVGDLVRSHPEKFGTTISYSEEPTLEDRVKELHSLARNVCDAPLREHLAIQFPELRDAIEDLRKAIDPKPKKPEKL